jgi:hypothetical protein
MGEICSNSSENACVKVEDHSPTASLLNSPVSLLNISLSQIHVVIFSLLFFSRLNTHLIYLIYIIDLIH